MTCTLTSSGASCNVEASQACLHRLSEQIVIQFCLELLHESLRTGSSLHTVKRFLLTNVAKHAPHQLQCSGCIAWGGLVALLSVLATISCVGWCQSPGLLLWMA